MPEGEIIRRGTPQPELRLGAATKWGAKAAGVGDIESVMRWLMDTAATTQQTVEEYLSEQKETNRLLAEILARIPQVPLP